MKEGPEILDTKEVAKTALFRVESVKLRFSNGEQRIYERLGTYGKGINAVMAIPVTDDQRFVMIEEYSVGTQSYELSFPKGLIDQGESLEEAALREMKEEAQIGAHKIQFLKSIALSPQYMCHKMGFLVARDLYEESLPGDEPEPLKVHRFSFEEALSLVNQNELIDVKTIAALYMARDFVQDNT